VEIVTTNIPANLLEQLAVSNADLLLQTDALDVAVPKISDKASIQYVESLLSTIETRIAEHRRILKPIKRFVYALPANKVEP
jgi:hypothetical protein